MSYRTRKQKRYREAIIRTLKRLLKLIFWFWDFWDFPSKPILVSNGKNDSGKDYWNFIKRLWYMPLVIMVFSIVLKYYDATWLLVFGFGLSYILGMVHSLIVRPGILKAKYAESLNQVKGNRNFNWQSLLKDYQVYKDSVYFRAVMFICMLSYALCWIGVTNVFWLLSAFVIVVSAWTLFYIILNLVSQAFHAVYIYILYAVVTLVSLGSWDYSVPLAFIVNINAITFFVFTLYLAVLLFLASNTLLKKAWQIQDVLQGRGIYMMGAVIGALSLWRLIVRFGVAFNLFEKVLTF